MMEDNGVSKTVVTSDMTVKEVAEETGRATSTVRRWLISEALRGYKINGRDWRVTRSALREYLTAQSSETGGPPPDAGEVDIADWRRVRGA